MLTTSSVRSFARSALGFARRNRMEGPERKGQRWWRITGSDEWEYHEVKSSINHPQLRSILGYNYRTRHTYPVMNLNSGLFIIGFMLLLGCEMNPNLGWATINGIRLLHYHLQMFWSAVPHIICGYMDLQWSWISAFLARLLEMAMERERERVRQREMVISEVIYPPVL